MSEIFPMCVVIPNWNLRAETIECVASVLAAIGSGRVSVVVVDNGSIDGSPESLTDFFGTRVIQMQMGQNMGYARAVNAGIQYALEHRFASVLVLNNDTFIDREMLMALNYASQRHPDAGILAPAIYYADTPTRIWRLGDRDHSWLPIPRRIPDSEVGNEVIEADYVTGCGMVIRREVFEAIGLFDEQFFVYYEDADFCKRARNHGFRILCVPAAKMWHKVSTTASRNAAVSLYWRARGQILFYRKHMGRNVLSHIFIVSKMLLVAIRYSLQGYRGYGRWVLRGMSDGYRISLRKEALSNGGD